jgi:cellobiose phosphorylase
MTASLPSKPLRLASPSGLVALLNTNGSLRRMECGPVVLNLFPGNEVEGGPANLYLRRRSAPTAWTPLLGPESPLAFDLDEGGLRGHGVWEGIDVSLAFVLAATAPAWFWHVELQSRASGGDEVDVVYAQDLGIAAYGAIRMNEYYVSQYLDHTPLAHPARGWAVATRQNLGVDGRIPWTVIGSLGRATSFATDALQLHGLATRAGDAPTGLVAPSLPGSRHQHEHAMAVIQDAGATLQVGAPSRFGFFGWFEPDHPAATSDADLAAIDRALALPEASHAPQPSAGAAPASAPAARRGSLFSGRPRLSGRDLTAEETAALWPGPWRHVERVDGELLSFFTADQTHVALRAKELRVLRPHGHLLRTGGRLVPDEASLTTTAWMAGVFHCLITQGHVSINRFLSTTRSYLGLQRSQGLRIFVERGDGWHLLDVPSAWEITPHGCRWLYAHDEDLIEVRVSAPVDRHQLDTTLAVRSGSPTRFLISSHVALAGDDGLEPAACGSRATRAGSR